MKGVLKTVLGFILLIPFANLSLASGEGDKIKAEDKEVGSGSKQSEVIKSEIKELENRVKKLELPSKLGFDLGFGVESYDDPYIAEASVGGDGIVRITDEYQVQPSLWLQFSWLSDKTWFGFGSGNCESVCAGGVFSGVRLAGQDSAIMDAFALGIVLASFKVGHGDPTQKSSISRFYVGLAPVIHRTRTFAEGISDGEPLPEDAIEIEYKRSYETSMMLMLGFRFK